MFSIRHASRVLNNRSRSVLLNNNKRAVPTCVNNAFFSAKPEEDEEENAVAVFEKERAETEAKIESEKSPALRHMEKMSRADPYMVFGSVEPMPDPVLPDDPSEIAALDPAHQIVDKLQTKDGQKRVVTIRQEPSKVTQAPTDAENNWVISFSDDGETAECWDNPLMGWVSGADPMAPYASDQMKFECASEAVYFAKKRGWNYVVEKPIYRSFRDDEAQYQDNFLPQRVAGMIKRDRHQCDYWHRDNAATSHYFRPLKYHGDGTVDQHGPNGGDPIAPHVEGMYKIR